MPRQRSNSDGIVERLWRWRLTLLLAVLVGMAVIGTAPLRSLSNAATGSLTDDAYPETDQAAALQNLELTSLGAQAQASSPKDKAQRCKRHYVAPWSRPGVPCLPSALKDPYRTSTPWREKLGQRLLKAVTPSVTEEDCGGFRLSGNFSWCLRALRRRQVVGISYGIGDRDPWSEKMSNVFGMTTRLYDCDPKPHSLTMTGKAKNATGPCQARGHEDPCYEQSHQIFHLCISPRTGQSGGKSFETLAMHLEGRGTVSVHMKIDIGGALWPVLADLLMQEKEVEKIRTLDLFVNFQNHRQVDEAQLEKLLTSRVQLLERLAERFLVVGSNLEALRERWAPEVRCREASCPEPALHLPSGLPLDKFALSYVHRSLVRAAPVALASPGAVPSGARQAPPEPARAPPPPAAAAAAPAAAASAVPMPAAVAQPKERAALVARSADPKCKKAWAGNPSSRPGLPCLPPSSGKPWREETEWRVELAERVLAAVTPVVTKKECERFELFGDSSWCMAGFKDKGVVGLSYGIEERDLWSEKMSNVFGMPTQLYDCFIPPSRSPPMAGTAPNGTRDCRSAPSHCYQQPYHPYRICLGPKETTIEGRQYETLLKHLRGRAPLSVHLKIDSEGTEWAVLEQLLASPADLEKIRTLDMEVHFSYVPEGDSEQSRKASEKDRLTSRVRVLERLTERFMATGSTLEVYREEKNDPRICPKGNCREANIHLRRGMSVDQFAVSYVHRDLLTGVARTSGPKPAPEGGEAQALPPAAEATAGSAAETSPPASVAAMKAQMKAQMARAADGAAAPASAPPSPAPAAPKAPEEFPEPPPCKRKYHSGSSRPGRPCMPRAKEKPYKTNTKWRATLGERVLTAVIGEVTEDECDGMELFGDSVWCLKAMKAKNVLGLSYGIEERDLWSEKMSNVFKMPTRLYDCFIPPRQSPPIAKTAPNATKPCSTVPGHCYDTPYWSYRVCLGPKEQVIDGRPYTTLDKHLAGRPRLSTHVKIDTEGTEWAILERLLDSPEDLDRIRTLEMEVHFSYVPEADDPEARRMPEQERLEKRVRIMERLRERFRCLGTNLEVYREGWKPEKECRKSRCGEPPIHQYKGMSVDQFAVSYVNKDLLKLEALD